MLIMLTHGNSTDEESEGKRPKLDTVEQNDGTTKNLKQGDGNSPEGSETKPVNNADKKLAAAIRKKKREEREKEREAGEDPKVYLSG